MTPLTIIGDRETVLAFRLGGVPGQVVETPAEARAAVAAAHRERRPGDPPALVVVTRGTAEHIRDYLDGVMLDPAAPLVLEIPGFGEPAGERPVERFVERVLGIHL
jgi:vacuolar-type H+-ATPase subunit F/Vma7